jgi:hypothetical protein
MDDTLDRMEKQMAELHLIRNQIRQMVAEFKRDQECWSPVSTGSADVPMSVQSPGSSALASSHAVQTPQAAKAKGYGKDSQGQSKGKDGKETAKNGSGGGWRNVKRKKSKGKGKARASPDGKEKDKVSKDGKDGKSGATGTGSQEKEKGANNSVKPSTPAKA